MTKQQASHVVLWSHDSVSACEIATQKVWIGKTVQEIKSHLPSGAPILVAVSRRSTFLRLTRVPDIARAEIAQMLRIQAAQMFPMAQEDIAFDFGLTHDVSPEGRLAVVMATKTEVLSAIRAAFQSQGLEVERVLPLGLGACGIAEAEGISDCAVVESGAEGLSIDVVQDGVLRYSRVCPAPQSAEQLEAEVCRTFAIAKVPCSKIIAAGGLIFGGADLSVETSSLCSLANLPADLKLNLEPSFEVVKRVKLRELKKQRLAAVAIVAALGAGLLVGFDRGEMLTKARKVDSQRNSQAQRIERTLSGLQSRLVAAQQVSDSLDRAFKPAQRFSDVLSVVNDSVPLDAWLTGFSLERGKDLVLRGTSKTNESITEFVRNLEASDRFRDVRLVYANNAAIEATPVVQFSVSAHVVGNLPLADKKAKSK